MLRQAILVTSSAAFLWGTAAAAEFTFGFRGCPAEMPGDPVGQTLELEVTLTSSGLSGDEGAQGWTWAAIFLGVVIKSTTLEGLAVDVLFDDDGDPSTPPIPGKLDLDDASLSFIEEEYRDSVSSSVSSSVQLHPSHRMYLPEGTQTIARVVLEVGTHPVVPWDCQTITVEWIRDLSVTSLGQSVNPRLGPRCVSNALSCEPPFILAVVPAGAEPPPGRGDFVLKQTVPPGDHLLEVDVLLKSQSGSSGIKEGPAGWALGLLHDEACMTVERLTWRDLEVSTIYDEDGDPRTAPLDPYPLALGKTYGWARRATGGGVSPLPDEARGVVSTVLLQFGVLHLNATETILKIAYRIDVPDGETIRCAVSFANGLSGGGSQPHWQLIVQDMRSHYPATRGLIVELTGKETRFRRGDANADGGLDLSDALFLLENLFLGGPRPSCRKTGDLDDNGSVEVTDPIYLLSFLFLGGTPPAGSGGCGGDATLDVLSCDSYPACAE